MTTIPLNTCQEDEYQKQLYSLKFNWFYLKRKRKNNARLLILFSGIYLIVAAFTGFHWVHVLIIAFVWLIFGLSSLMDKYSHNRAQNRLGEHVDHYYNPSLRTSVAFDSTAVSFIIRMLPERKTTLAWEQFIGYNNSGDVLLLATTKPKEYWTFTRHEMGEEAYTALSKLAMEKLPTLTDYFERRKEWWRFFYRERPIEYTSQ